MTLAVSQGTGRRGSDVLGTLTGMMLQERMIMPVRHGNRLYLIEQPHAYLDQEGRLVGGSSDVFSDGDCVSSDLGEDRAVAKESEKESEKKNRKQTQQGKQERRAARSKRRTKEPTNTGDVLVGLDELLLEDLLAGAAIDAIIRRHHASSAMWKD